MINTLKQLCLLRGVSGDEGSVRDYIISQIENTCEYSIDNMGNIIIFKKGKSRANHKLMLSAHMDEVGFMITSINEKGYLRFSPVGGIDPRVVFGRRVLVGNGNIPGVIAAAPIHLLSAGEKDKSPDFDSLFIDIGAESFGQAAALISPGDTAVFDTSFDEFGGTLIKAKALDDRAGCAILIDILKSDVPYDIFASFVVQEEVGLRGARCAAYSIDPEFAIVLEATTAADIPDVPPEKQVCELKKGAVLSFMDSRTIYDRGMYQTAMSIAEKKSIKIQVKRAVAGGNDAGAISVSRSGVKTLAVSLPCRYLHSPASLIAVEDLNSSRDLVFELISVFPS